MQNKLKSKSKSKLKFKGSEWKEVGESRCLDVITYIYFMQIKNNSKYQEELLEGGALFFGPWLTHITDPNLEIQLSLKSLLVALLGKLPLTK